MLLSTERLHLRPWREADLAPFAALNADPRVMEFMPCCLTRAESDALAKRIRGHFQNYGFGLWALEVPGRAPFAGFVGLEVTGFQAHFTPCVEISWRLAFEYWGHGYATEAARRVLAHGFGVIGLPEVVSFTSPLNRRSRAVMDRLGMHHEGAFEHPALPAGHPHRPHLMYRISLGVC